MKCRFNFDPWLVELVYVSCLGQASEGADVPYEGGNYYPRGVPFHLFLMCIAASSSSSDGGSTAIKGTGVERDHLFPPTPNQLGPWVTAVEAPAAHTDIVHFHCPSAEVEQRGKGPGSRSRSQTVAQVTGSRDGLPYFELKVTLSWRPPERLQEEDQSHLSKMCSSCAGTGEPQRAQYRGRCIVVS